MDPTQSPISTGTPWLDALLQIAGALGLIASTFATFAPKAWAATQIAARYFADVRGIHKADP